MKSRTHLKVSDYRKLIKQNHSSDSYAVKFWFTEYKKYGGKLTLGQIRKERIK